MRKSRITQAQRIANLEQSLYVLALRLEQLNKRIDDTQSTTNTDSHDNQQEGVIKVYTEKEYQHLTWWELVKHEHNIKTI
jgi:hypothetical protein